MISLKFQTQKYKKIRMNKIAWITRKITKLLFTAQKYLLPRQPDFFNYVRGLTTPIGDTFRAIYHRANCCRRPLPIATPRRFDTATYTIRSNGNDNDDDNDNNNDNNDNEHPKGGFVDLSLDSALNYDNNNDNTRSTQHHSISPADGHTNRLAPGSISFTSKPWLNKSD